MKRLFKTIFHATEFYDVIGFIGFGMLFYGLRFQYSLPVAMIIIGALFIIMALMGAYTHSRE